MNRGHVALAALAALGCSSTTDSLGTNQTPTRVESEPEPEPEPPSSTFGDVLERSPDEIDDKLAAAFEQLFHGDPTTEAIYFEEGSDLGYIYNAAESEIRTDGLAYGMMITVQLDKPDEFARLWAYTQANHQYTTGPREGFLYWDCPEATLGCPDPNGMQYAAAALLCAARRWDEPTYAEAADHLLEVMLHREELNGDSVVEGVHDVFDPTANVVRMSPVAEIDNTTPSYVMPAFTGLFAEQGVDGERWNQITATGRELIRRVMETPTGLPMDRTDLEGNPVSTAFGSEALRVGLNLAVDHLWHDTDWSPQTNKMLEFFASQPAPYMGRYDAETGAATVTWQDGGLQSTNGAAAIAATTSVRSDFVQVVWDMPIPTGANRYYGGILYLMSLMALSGEYQIR